MKKPHRITPLAPLTPAQFYLDFARYVAFALGLLVLFLGAGVLGYHRIVGLDWIDSLLNASMILGGMGPLSPVDDDAGKIFASLYALFSGAAYPALTALVLYPLVQRMMRILHLRALAAAAGGTEPADDGDDDADDGADDDTDGDTDGDAGGSGSGRR